MINLIYFILVMGVIVLVHEVGHLVTAKLFGVYCYEFSIGMGPKLFSIQGKETRYSIRLFPIGGYVQMAGENEMDKELYPDLDIPFERTINGIKPFKKIIVLFSGALMNFLLAWFIVSGILMSVGRYPVPSKPIIASVVEGSPADLSGFEVGDEITKVVFADGTVIHPKTFDDFALFTQTYSGEMTFTILRNDEVKEVVTQGKENNGVYKIGFGAPLPEYVSVNLVNGLYYGADYLGEISRAMFNSLARLIQGNGLDQLSGPVGIYQATAQQAQYGIVGILLWIAILSLNLGIFNLLPVPALDGGRIVLTGIEWITGKPINKKIETALIAGSMILLILMILLVTGQDILRMI